MAVVRWLLVLTLVSCGEDPPAPEVEEIDVAVGPVEATEVSVLSATVTTRSGQPAQAALQWFVEGQPASDGDQLDGEHFDKGDGVWCVATPTTGEPAQSDTVVIQNTPPTLTDVVLDPALPAAGGVVSPQLGQSSDADGDTITFEYAWVVDGSSASSSEQLTSEYFAKHSVIELTVTPFDGEAKGQPVVGEPVVAVNTPPDAPADVTMAPTDPLAAEDLVCTWSDATDADDDALQYVVTWMLDGDVHHDEVTSATSATLSAADTVAGQLWSCVVQARDDDEALSTEGESLQVQVVHPWRISVGSSSACALEGGGERWCWGNNYLGSFGDGTTVGSLSPKQVGSILYDRVSLRANHACGIAQSGKMYCWGYNLYGATGEGPKIVQEPHLISVDTDWAEVTTGDLHSCGITNSGDMKCWGGNAWGALGNGVEGNTTTPSLVIGGKKWRQVSARLHTCGVTIDDELYCWGYGRSLYSADVGAVQRTPVQIGESYAWKEVSNGVDHTCGVTLDNQLLCWGRNDSGQVGDGTRVSGTEPKLVTLDRKWIHVSVGRELSCGETEPGYLYCWGTWPIGDGTRTWSLDPAEVTLEGPWTEVSTAGKSTTCGLVDGKLHCWGQNFEGTVGDGTKTERLEAVPIE